MGELLLINSTREALIKRRCTSLQSWDSFPLSCVAARMLPIAPLSPQGLKSPLRLLYFNKSMTAGRG